MGKMVSKFVAENLAKAYGEFCKIRPLDERDAAENLQCLGVVHRLMEQQREAGIVLVEQRKLAKLAAFFESEAA